MTNEQILQEVKTSSWQPNFYITNNLDEVVDNILKPHEDYFLGLQDKVKEIIEREIEYAKTSDAYEITFADICNWQKELFEYKEKVWREQVNEAIDNKWMGKVVELKNLPNRYINLGLRKTNVKVGNWTPPHPMFLQGLKSMCFPITCDNDCRRRFSLDYSWYLGLPNHYWYEDENSENELNGYLTSWYKTFQTIHFFEDLNGRLGGIVIAILSYILSKKYLTK